MLTVEILRQNAALSGLNDEQLNAIATMSQNDENTVIGARIGELHGQYDADVLGVSGISKKSGEKSYDYVKRVLGDYKAKFEASKNLQTQLDAANAQIEELKTKGSDEAVRQELKDTKTRVEQLKNSLQAKETEFATAKADLEKQVMNAHVDYAFQAATAGLKFKDGISESLKGVILGAAKNEILMRGTPELIDDGKGGKRLALRGTDGNLVNNPKNGLAPYTIQELVMETSLKDAISTAPNHGGGGTGPTPPPDPNLPLDLSGAKTQLEADNMIEHYLLTVKGFTRDQVEFGEESLKLRTEANVASLPIR